MTVDEFNTVLDARIEKIRAVLAKKADEYGVGDRLHNFKAGAAALGQSPEETCLGLMIKHWVSTVDLVHDSADGKSGRVIAMLDEKIGDLTNYCILLECCLLEANRAPESV